MVVNYCLKIMQTPRCPRQRRVNSVILIALMEWGRKCHGKKKNIVLADLLGDYPLLYGGQFVQSSQDDLSTKRKQYNSNSTKYGCIVYSIS